MLNEGTNKLLDKFELRLMLLSMEKTNNKLEGKGSVNEQDLEMESDQQLKKWDNNKDDNLGKEEFYKLFQKNEIILRFLQNCGLMCEEDEEQMKDGLNDEYDHDLMDELNLYNN